MRSLRNSAIGILLLACMIVGTGCTQAKQAQTPLTAEAEILALVNEARVTNELSALVRIERMDVLALEHSQDMAKAGNLSHDGFDARRTV